MRHLRVDACVISKNQAEIRDQRIEKPLSRKFQAIMRGVPETEKLKFKILHGKSLNRFLNRFNIFAQSFKIAQKWFYMFSYVLKMNISLKFLHGKAFKPVFKPV